ncbi:MAG TPA: hypothetical protein PLB78_09285, partial [Anaerolineae bacterium]|nr:hypothetical protein [Anaerolineae bacterium]
MLLGFIPVKVQWLAIRRALSRPVVQGVEQVGILGAGARREELAVQAIESADLQREQPFVPDSLQEQDGRLPRLAGALSHHIAFVAPGKRARTALRL